ncbi:hypothetical protein IWX46DRAFT_41254 [Phyllosticta citricarpa]|uniref:Uncharacterized protein n=1 Tax=Phyllosticta citricarpa TaxID=55181 RepID=A0ABR1MJR3_9PEZI
MSEQLVGLVVRWTGECCISRFKRWPAQKPTRFPPAWLNQRPHYHTEPDMAGLGPDFASLSLLCSAIMALLCQPRAKMNVSHPPPPATSFGCIDRPCPLRSIRLQDKAMAYATLEITSANEQYVWASRRLGLITQTRLTSLTARIKPATRSTKEAQWAAQGLQSLLPAPRVAASEEAWPICACSHPNPFSQYHAVLPFDASIHRFAAVDDEKPSYMR